MNYEALFTRCDCFVIATVFYFAAMKESAIVSCEWVF